MFDFGNTYLPDTDGIDHINIFSKGKTELGVLLSNFTRTEFEFEPYGKFQSAEGFYFWFLTSEKFDELRNLSGKEAKDYGNTLKSFRIDRCGMTDEILEVLNKMTRAKVNCNPRIAELLKSSILPFVHYYCYEGKVTYPSGYDWLSPAYEQIRNELKSN